MAEDSLSGRMRMTTAIMPMIGIRVRDSYASIVMRWTTMATTLMVIALCIFATSSTTRRDGNEMGFRG